MPDPIKIELVIPQPRAVVSFHVKQIAGEGGGTGPQGPPGADGQDGLSAYEIWLAQGNTGNEAAFLLSLKGEQGATGPAGADGINGTNGADGIDGADGADGLSAYQIWLAAGNTGDEAAFLLSLKGEQGETGPSGVSKMYDTIRIGSTVPSPAGTIRFACVGFAGLSTTSVASISPNVVHGDFKVYLSTAQPATGSLTVKRIFVDTSGTVLQTDTLTIAAGSASAFYTFNSATFDATACDCTMRFEIQNNASTQSGFVASMENQYS